MKIIKCIVENGADVNEIVNNKFSALTLMCKLFNYWDDNYHSIIKYLIKQGADVNLPVKNNKTPLYYLFKYYKNEPMIKYLIEHGANVHNTMKNSGSKFLIRVCEVEDEIYIKYLVNYGADVNIKDVIHIKVNGVKVKNEYEEEEDFDVYDDYGGDDDKEVLSTPLIISCRYGNFDLVKYLIEHGANVNDEMEDGNTALTVACRFMRRNYNSKIIKYLIEQGADVNKKGRQYMKTNKMSESYNDTKFIEATPLILACLYENKNLVKYLIEHGANVNVKAGKETPLPLVKERGNKSLKKYLIDNLDKKRKKNKKEKKNKKRRKS